VSDGRIPPSEDTAIRLIVQPAPSDEELAALAGAIAALRRQPAVDAGRGHSARPVLSRWALAGRRDAMRGIGRDGDESSRA
jgi:hypothetical protein